MIKHFVTFYSPGTFVSESTTKEIPSWDTALACEMAKDIVERHGATPYAFVFTTRDRADSELDSKVTKTSNKFYLGGVVKTYEDIVAEKDPKNDILEFNMRVVEHQGAFRSVHPLEEGDVVIPFGD